VTGAAASGHITNARLADGRLVDIEITDGRIASVSPSAPMGSDPASASMGSDPASASMGSDPGGVGGGYDVRGWLLLAAMAEPHAHLDKALTADLVPNPAGDLKGAIDAWIEATTTGRITHDDTVARAVNAAQMLAVRGVTAVRSHVNVGEGYGAASIKAINQAREQLDGLIELQTVALVHSPLTGSDGAGNRAALDEAVEAGANLIGGCPHLDPDGSGLISHCIAVAAQAGLPLDLHVDETLDASMLTLPDYARQVIDIGFSNGVTASHCVSLGMQGPRVQAEVAAVVAEAQMAVVALPQTNLFLQARDVPTAAPRGLTAIDPLLAANAVVAAGGDNVQDPFNLMGRSDPLETAALMVMAGHRSPEVAYDMVSNSARLAMGLEPVNFEPGDPADFVAIDAPTLRAAMADAPMSRRTFRAGKLIASTDQQTTIY